MRLAKSVVMVVLLPPALASAGALDVVNPGFEADTNINIGSAIGYSGGSGTFNPYHCCDGGAGGGFYSGATALTEPAAPAGIPGTDGNHLGFINESPSTLFTQVLSGPDQVAGNGDDPTYQLGMNYTLTVANGRRGSGQSFQGSNIGFRVGNIVLGNDIIASTSENSADPRAPLINTFSDHTYTLNSTNLHPELVGQPITIFFGTTTGGGATDFDRVRVDATAVPEPAAFATMMLGAGLFFRRGRKA